MAWFWVFGQSWAPKVNYLRNGKMIGSSECGRYFFFFLELSYRIWRALLVLWAACPEGTDGSEWPWAASRGPNCPLLLLLLTELLLQTDHGPGSHCVWGCQWSPAGSRASGAARGGQRLGGCSLLGRSWLALESTSTPSSLTPLHELKFS